MPVAAKLSRRFYETFGDEMHEGFGRLRAEVIKWMFVFWAGTFATTAGLLLATIGLLR